MVKVREKTRLKEFFAYASLNVLGMVGLSCYILADTFFVSKGLGTNGLAALNLAIPVYGFVHGSGMLLGMGGATRYAVLKGRGEKEEGNRVFVNTIFLAAIFSAVFLIFGLFFSGMLTSALGADAEVFSMTNTYLKVILLFSPAFILNDVLICFVRNDSAPRLAMFAMLAGSFANIVLDYVFIFPLQMGIFGAVLATGFSPLIGIMVMSLHFIRKKNSFRLVKDKPNGQLMRKILSLGFPSFLTEASAGIVIIVFNMLMLRLEGNVGVAAYGVVANLSLVVTAVFTGIAQGIQPLVSRAHGGGDNKAARQVLRYALITAAVVSCAIYCVMFFAASPLVAIFNGENDEKLRQIATAGLRLYFIAVFFLGFNLILSMFFASVEKAIFAHIVSLLRGLILIIPAAFLLSFLWGVSGVWLSLAITEGLVAALCAVLLKRFLSRQRLADSGAQPQEELQNNAEQD